MSGSIGDVEIMTESMLSHKGSSSCIPTSDPLLRPLIISVGISTGLPVEAVVVLEGMAEATGGAKFPRRPVEAVAAGGGDKCPPVTVGEGESPSRLAELELPEPIDSDNSDIPPWAAPGVRRLSGQGMDVHGRAWSCFVDNTTK